MLAMWELLRGNPLCPPELKGTKLVVYYAPHDFVRHFDLWGWDGNMLTEKESIMDSTQELTMALVICERWM